MRYLKKLLIANRGEIAVRIMRLVLLMEMYKKMNLIIDKKIRNPFVYTQVVVC